MNIPWVEVNKLHKKAKSTYFAAKETDSNLSFFDYSYVKLLDPKKP